MQFDRELPGLLLKASGDTTSGSTAVMVMVSPSHWICANVGDSRAAYLSGGRTLALSEDHKCR